MTKKLWFRARPYGWGWQPATKEGWGVMLVWLIALLVTAWGTEIIASPKAVAAFLALTFLYTGILIYVAYRTGEKPLWKWEGREVHPSVVVSHFFGLLLWIGLAECAGLLGALFTIHAIPEWYIFLRKPFFSPPNWLFGPVWTALYFLMSVAAYRVWVRAVPPIRTNAITAYFIQLGLNALWTPIFFGLHSPILGLVVIVSLLAMIVVTIYRFTSIDRTAALLLVPYLGWVAFATALNLFIVILN